TTSGAFEFRLFANDGLTRLATSPAVTLNGAIPTLAVNSTTVNGGSTVTVTMSNGPGHRTDWVGLFQQGAANTGYADWQYLGGANVPPVTGSTSATLPFTMPTAAGPFEFRLFANNGFTVLATSQAVTVNVATPTLTVSSTTVNGGATVTVTVSNGPGNRADWVGVFPLGAANTGYVDWKYLNGAKSAPGTGLTGATLTFTMPSTAGSFEFRLFSNDGFTVLATSQATTIVQIQSPALAMEMSNQIWRFVRRHT